MFGDRKLPLVLAAWLIGGPSAWAVDAAVTAAPDPDLLADIARRQTELAVLELDIKKAELQKKLRELQPSALPPGLAAIPPLAVDAALPAAKAPEFQARIWSVQRIHRIGERLAALIRFPGGETRDVFPGGKLDGDLKLVAVTPGEVTARRSAGEAFSLPVLTATAERR